MLKETGTLLFILILTLNSSAQIVEGKAKIPDSYSNWLSADYLQCLKNKLPCECEQSKEYFLMSIDSSKKIVLLYEGKSNYDYHSLSFKTISSNNLLVYNDEYSYDKSNDTNIVAGQIIWEGDSLFYVDVTGKKTTFLGYSTGSSDDYLKEHLKILNTGLKLRGYDDLNKTLQSGSLKCWCDWELDGGINIIYENDKYWILERKGNVLSIYKWTNPPIEKTSDLMIKKTLLKELTW